MDDCKVATFLIDVLEHENEPYLTTEGAASKPVGARQCPKQPGIFATKLLMEIEYELSSIRKEFNKVAPNPFGFAVILKGQICFSKKVDGRIVE